MDFPTWYHAIFHSDMILVKNRGKDTWAICPENQMGWTYFLTPALDESWLVCGEKEGEEPFYQRWIAATATAPQTFEGEFATSSVASRFRISQQHKQQQNVMTSEKNNTHPIEMNTNPKDTLADLSS